MKIAVIGDYNSPQYKTLLQIVKMHFPGDNVLDLSVHQNADYKNDWKGVNNSGQKLVQGTYFVLLELPNGDKKSMYVDIRY